MAESGGIDPRTPYGVPTVFETACLTIGGTFHWRKAIASNDERGERVPTTFQIA